MGHNCTRRSPAKSWCVLVVATSLSAAAGKTSFNAASTTLVTAISAPKVTRDNTKAFLICWARSRSKPEASAEAGRTCQEIAFGDETEVP